MAESMPAFAEGYKEVNGVRLHYVEQGQGPLLLLLHGFPEFWYSWRHQIPFLAQRFHVVAPDLRGYNLSDKPQGVSQYFMDKLTGDVLALIRAFDAEKAVVVGHDWGGVIAWDVAAFHPEAVERLVILNAPHPTAFLRELSRNPRQIRSSWYVFMFQLPRLPEWYASRGNFEMLERVFRGWVHRKETFSEEDIRLYKQAMGQPGCLTAAINYYRGLFRAPGAFQRLRRYPKIRVPTLLVWGEDDRALTIELTCNLDPYFEAPLQIRRIPGCSHWVQQERPEEVNRFLEEFLF
jgi:pimeloyl-ACP methyl ester carboxylesterase